MLSSISSSDRKFIGALLIWVIVLSAAANLLAGYVLRHLPGPTLRVQMLKYAIPAAIEDYVANYRSCPVVVLGSSIVGALPPPGWERPGVCSIAMVGQGPFPALDIMDRLQAAPRVLFLESNLGFRDSEPGQVAGALSPVIRAVHRWLPLTRATGNWINALWKLQNRVTTDLYRPNIPWETWRSEREREVHGTAYTNPLTDWDRWYVGEHVKRTAELIASLESRGTKVIFFQSPMEPRISTLPIFALWAEKEHDAFADHEWVTDAREKYYLADGIHFTSGSGEDFFNLLMARAPQTAASLPQ